MGGEGRGGEGEGRGPLCCITAFQCRAMLQNKSLKEQLAELQDRFVTMVGREGWGVVVVGGLVSSWHWLWLCVCVCAEPPAHGGGE